jgi:sulfur-oxidizing protein SoxY
MNPLRRTVLKSTFTLAALAGILPSRVFAAEWNKAAFESKSVVDAIKGIGMGGAVDSKDIIIKAPEIAESGNNVQIEVTSNIPGTQSISILAEKNPSPLIAQFDLSNGAEGYISTRIKMSQTSNVRVMVKAGGKVYTAAKEVKVTIGGCGG